MRVIAGSCKGFILKVPERSATRPATELVRGAMFSILENLTDRWDTVLDLFSGSGSLGIEALSRGAGEVDFVEHDRRACNVLKENLEHCNLMKRAHVYCARVEPALKYLNRVYDIVLMDPPYRKEDLSDFLAILAASPIMGEHTVLATTRSPRQALKERYGLLKLVKEHRHGDSVIAIYRREEI